MFFPEEAPGEDTDELRYDSTAMADQSEATMDGTAAGYEPTNDGAAGFEEQEQEPAADRLYYFYFIISWCKQLTL